jgi:hypothetical protein
LLKGPGVTARLSEACVAAVRAHNRERGWPSNRIGISVPVGGVHGESATYRRVDVKGDQSVRQSVDLALRDPAVPSELAHIPRWASLIRPVIARLSDTCLVSNLGRCEVPGVSALEIFPVARGRSAVAFGATGIPGRPATLTLRARDLDRGDATMLLDRAVDELSRSA